jgi:ABC-2 type transport system permease protein
MSFDPVAGIVVRQMYLLRGNFPRVVQLFVWVLVDIVLWGYMTRYMNAYTHGFAPVAAHYNFVPAVLGAVLLWDFLIRIMQGVSLAYMEDSWSRNLLNIFASPISIGQYLTGLILTSIITSLIGVAAMVLIATAVFGLSFFAYGVWLAPFLMVLFLNGIALGIVATTIMLRYGPASEWLVWPIPAVISPFVGVFYPMDVLPLWMQKVGHFLPPSYVFTGLRSVVAGGTVSVELLVWSFILSFVYILLACLLFLRVYRYAVRVGLIARHSAESF